MTDALRAALRRLRDEGGERAVVGPAEGPGGPWVAFRELADGTLLLETDEAEERAVEERDGIEAAARALAAWGLDESDPLICFLEGVDRDPADDDPYDAHRVLRTLGRARLLRRSLSVAYEAFAGPVRMTAAFPSRRHAEVEVHAPKPVNAAQAQRLRELGLSGSGDRWSGRVSADAMELEAIVPSVWARVRDAAFD